jgi:hypothetical protein
VVDCWVLGQDALLSFLAGRALGLWFGPSAFRLVVTFLGIVWFSSKAVLERTEVGRWKGKVVEDVGGRKCGNGSGLKFGKLKLI